MTKHENKPGWESGDPRNDRIYLAILGVLMATVVAAAIVTLVGELVFQSPAMKTVGFSVALIAGAIYFFFRFLGGVRYRQWLARRRKDEADGL